MRVFALFLTASLFLLATSSSEQSRRQAPDPCPPITCADPRYSQGDSCGSCEGSQCMLRGCVNSGAFFVTWRPDPCTWCNCMDGREVCAVVDCAPAQCYGFPIVTRPGRCCQECDYNISRTECGVVPTGTRRVEVPLGDTTCQQDVFEYECDKQYIADDSGAWFMCDPVQEEVTVSAGDLPTSRCGPLVSQVTYQTVARCQKRQLTSSETPQDLDLDPYSCYYVDGSDTEAPTGSPTNDVVSSATPIATPIAMPLLLTCIVALRF